MSPTYRSLLSLILAIAFLPVAAAASSPGRAPAAAPEAKTLEVFSGEMLLETLSSDKLVVALDAYSGLEVPNGWLDQLLVFVSEEPLEPLEYRGFGLVRIEERTATIVLPERREMLLLSLSDAPTPAPPTDEDHVELRILDRGIALVTHVPAERQTLAEAVATERTRQRVRALDFVFQQDPGAGDGSGENCKSSCSSNCHDGSSCNVSCNSSQCAECSDCPANCYCRTRTGL